MKQKIVFSWGGGHEVAWIAHTECEIADCKTSALLHWTYLMQVHQICHGINVCVQRGNSHCQPRAQFSFFCYYKPCKNRHFSAWLFVLICYSFPRVCTKNESAGLSGIYSFNFSIYFQIALPLKRQYQFALFPQLLRAPILPTSLLTFDVAKSFNVCQSDWYEVLSNCLVWYFPDQQEQRLLYLFSFHLSFIF